MNYTGHVVLLCWRHRGRYVELNTSLELRNNGAKNARRILMGKRLEV